ncbi:MAG: Hsp20/alpha crystallin family protein [Actinomycetota bacterium]
MRLGPISPARDEFDDLVNRFFGDGHMLAGRGTPLLRSGGFDVPTDMFRTEDEIVIRMDLPGVKPEDVEVTVQDNVLVINGSRAFPFDAEKVRFLRRGTFYGDFTQRVSLGKGLKLDAIAARFDAGVLEVMIPYAEEVQPRKISIEVGATDAAKELPA